MNKSPLKIFLALLILVIALTACAGGTTGTGQEGTGGTPGAGDTTGGTTGGETPAAGAGGDTGAATQAVPETGAGGAAANCAGVDTQQLMTAGQTAYAEQCASCHGEQGEGQGDFPGLAANANVTGDAAALVQSYFAVDAHPKDVTPEQLAGVLTYVRGSFGNTGQPVCPTDVQVPAAQ